METKRLKTEEPMNNLRTVDKYIKWCEDVCAEIRAYHEELCSALEFETELDVVRACIAKWRLISGLAGMSCAGCRECDISAGSGWGSCADCIVEEECNNLESEPSYRILGALRIHETRLIDSSKEKE